MVKKAPEEIRNGKTEASKNMGMKNDRFTQPLVRKGLPIRSPPMDHVSGLKKVLIYKTEQMGVGTLTRLPPMGFRIISGSFARLPPPSKSFWRHGNEEEDDSFLLHAWGLAVASFSWHLEARAEELNVAEQIKMESVLNLGLLEELNKQSQWQFL